MPKNALLTSTGTEKINSLRTEFQELKLRYPNAEAGGSSPYAQQVHTAINALLETLVNASTFHEFFQLGLFNFKPKPSLFAENIKDNLRSLSNDDGVYFSVENDHLKNIAKLITEKLKDNIEDFFDLKQEKLLQQLNITPIYIASKIKAYIKILKISCKIFEDTALDKKIFSANSESATRGWMPAQYRINTSQQDENANVDEISGIWKKFLATEGKWVTEYSNNPKKDQSKRERIKNIWQVIAVSDTANFLHFQTALHKVYSELMEILSEFKDEFLGESEEAIAGWVLSLHDLILTSRECDNDVYLDALTDLPSMSELVEPTLSASDKVRVFEAMFESVVDLYNEASPDTKIPEKGVTLKVKMALYSRNFIVENFRQEIGRLINDIVNPQQITEKLTSFITNLEPIYTEEMFSGFRTKNFLAHLHALETLLPSLVDSKNSNLQDKLVNLVNQLVEHYNYVRLKHYSREKLVFNREERILNLNRENDPRNTILQNMLNELLEPECKLADILTKNVNRITQLQELHKSRFPGIGKVVRSDLVECIKKFNLELMLVEVMQNKIKQLQCGNISSSSSKPSTHVDELEPGRRPFLWRNKAK